MTPERFRALAEAYGGDLGRWPSAERKAARLHLRQQPDARDMLVDVAKLDDALAAWAVQGPGAALAGRIEAAVARRRTHARRFRLWLSGLGAATALAGGLAAGSMAVALSAPASEQVTTPLYELSVLGAPLDIEIPSAGSSRS